MEHRIGLRVVRHTDLEAVHRTELGAEHHTGLEEGRRIDLAEGLHIVHQAVHEVAEARRSRRVAEEAQAVHRTRRTAAGPAEDRIRRLVAVDRSLAEELQT